MTKMIHRRATTTPRSAAAAVQGRLSIEQNDNNTAAIDVIVERNFQRRGGGGDALHQRLRKRAASVLEDQSHYPTSYAMILILSFCGCVSLISQVSFIYYVSSMTYTGLEKAFYPSLKNKHHPRVASSMEDTKPRLMGYYFQDGASSTLLGSERLDPNMHRQLTNNIIEIEKDELKRQQHLENSEDYYDEQMDPFEDGVCVAQYEWQTKSFPTCNLLHEVDMTAWNSTIDEETVRVFSLGGFWRDVWIINSTVRQEEHILKTMRFAHEISERNFDRHRRDALAMDRLTSSPNVIHIFGFCGNSGITEYADGGTLEDVIYNNNPPNASSSSSSSSSSWNSSEKIAVAYQIATALSDVHNSDKAGQASIAHTDITPSQFLYMKEKGKYILNDFNRCRFISWNKKLNIPCGFEIGNNPGTFRAPEEYLYVKETEKIDVYSMGNIFYSLLTADWPFDREKDEIGQRLVTTGSRPPISQELRQSQDLATQAIIQAIEMCWKQDPTERASATQVESFLGLQLLQLGMAETPKVVESDPDPMATTIRKLDQQPQESTT